MAHYYLGLLYFNRNPEDEQKPLEEFTAMNAIDPGNEFSEVGQAYIDANRGRDEEALKRVDGIEQRDRAASTSTAGGEEQSESWRNPGLANVWLIRGIVYGKPSGKFYNPAKGVEAYSNYLLYDSEKPSPFSNRGVLHEALYLSLRENPNTAKEAEAHLDAAIADYTRALEVDPRFKNALQHRGYAYFKYKKDTPAALRDIDAALAVDPKYTTVILDRAAIHEEEGNFALAEKDYLLVKEMDPRHINIDYRLGMLALYTGNLEQASQYLTASILAVADKGAQGIRYHRRGSVRLLLGKYAEAVDDFDKSLAYRRSAHIYPALMRWVAMGKLAPGILPDPSELAKVIDGGGARPWLTVAASVYMGDDPDGAEQALRLATSPEAVSEAAFYLGARAWVLNDLESAITYFQRAVDGGYHLATEYAMSKILLPRLQRQLETSRQLPDTVGLPPTVPSLSDLVE
jgi:tetratricopeptide (TPR) repeat protein